MPNPYEGSLRQANDIGQGEYNPETGQGGKGRYNAVTSGSEDYATYDPLGLSGALGAGITGVLGGQNNLTSNYDPNAFYTQFLKNAGGASDLVSGSLSPLEKQLTERATRMSEAAGRSVAGGFASGGYGSLRSGAAAGAIGTGMAQPFADAQALIGGKQVDATQALWNNMLGTGGTQYGIQGQLGLSAAQGNQNALLTALGLGTDSMTTVAPQYEYKPTTAETALGYASPLIGSAIGAAAGKGG